MTRTEFLETLAIVFSASAITLLVFTAILAAKELRKTASAKFLLLVVVSVAAMELSSGPLQALMPNASVGVLKAIGVINVTALWWFSLSLLVEGFRLRTVEWIGGALFILGPVIVALQLAGDDGVAGYLGTFASIAPLLMMTHLVWTAASGLSDDLVAGRRLARVGAPMVLVAAAVVSILSEQVSDRALGSIVRNGLATAPAALFLLLWLTHLNLSKLRFEVLQRETAPAAGIDPRDTILHAALVKAMDHERLFQDHDLSLDRLASHLRTPAHRLRTLINSGLGFRNFSTFLNAHRLAHAKSALSDPMRGRDSILVIAYESGFAVLQTFNRVFKETEGVTPKDYRATALLTLAEPVDEPN